MRIERVNPPPRPLKDFALIFPPSEGWAIVAALREYADKHPDAANAKTWAQWAKDLDKKLRNDPASPPKEGS